MLISFVRIAGPALLLLALPGLGCGSPPPDASGPRIVERTRPSMGAEAHLTAWTDDPDGALAAFDAIFDELERLESIMSVWHPGSEIVRLNEAAGQHAVAVSNDVMEALERAREASAWTDGAFDVTFGALAGVWKFDHDQDNRIPPPEEIAERLPLVNYRALELHPSQGTAYLKHRGMRAHLGGIGKGYAVDRAADILRARGLRDFIIQFGGDMYVAGRRGDRPWRLGIQDPRGEANSPFATLDLSDAALSTSGDYERFFMKDGRRYHHIIDPRTGAPARGARSVTIVAQTATVADALSTGVFVLGPERGLALVERLPDVEGVIVSDANQVLASTGLQDRLDVRAPPTDAP